MKHIADRIMVRFRARTITRDLATGLVLVISAILILIGGLNYLVSVRQVKSDLEFQSREMAEKLAEILSSPLWSLDLYTVEKIADAYRQSENVVGVKVVNDAGDVIYVNQRGEPNLITSTEPVYYQDWLIGQVEISFSTQNIRTVQRNIFITTLSTVAGVFLAVFLSTRILLKKYLDRPLENLTQGINTIASGNYTQTLEPVAQVDLNEIIACVNAMARQIAERVEALRESQERFRQVIDSISDYVYVFEINERGEGINQYLSPRLETLAGYPMAQLQEDWYFYPNRVIYPADRERAAAQLVRLSRGENSETEYRLVCANGEILWVRDSARVEQTASSKLVYGVISDITERKRVEEELRAETIERKQAEQNLRKYQEHLEELIAERTAELNASNQELESFAYRVSHDLRAPLRGIHGYSSILAEDFGDQLPGDAWHYLDHIRHYAQRMNDLIEVLLNFSKLGRQALNKEHLQPEQVVQLVLNELEPELRDRQADIRIGDLPACQADPQLLRQVYKNLIDNAIKFTRNRAEARIQVGASVENNQVIYFVQDNGVGFNMDYAEKLFGVFQRLHPEKEYEGTGAGLSIVQRIIQRHGGKIWAESEVDQGAVFYFTLPD